MLISNCSLVSVADDNTAIVLAHLPEHVISLQDCVLPEIEGALLHLISAHEVLDRLEQIERNGIMAFEEVNPHFSRGEVHRGVKSAKM